MFEVKHNVEGVYISSLKYSTGPSKNGTYHRLDVDFKKDKDLIKESFWAPKKTENRTVEQVRKDSKDTMDKMTQVSVALFGVEHTKEIWEEAQAPDAGVHPFIALCRILEREYQNSKGWTINNLILKVFPNTKGYPGTPRWGLFLVNPDHTPDKVGELGYSKWEQDRVDEYRAKWNQKKAEKEAKAYEKDPFIVRDGEEEGEEGDPLGGVEIADPFITSTVPQKEAKAEVQVELETHEDELNVDDYTDDLPF